MLFVKCLTLIAALAASVNAVPRPGGAGSPSPTTPPVTTVVSTVVPPVTTVVPPAGPAFKPKFLGQIPLKSVSFAKVVENEDKTSICSCRLLLPFASDTGYFISNVGSTLNSFNTTVPAKIGGSLTWPNEIDAAPSKFFNGKDGVVAAGGFLVPGKSNGGIWFSEKTGAKTQGNWVPLFTSGSGYFYHRVQFADMDGDGLDDILTCRANKPLVGAVRKGKPVFLTPTNRTNLLAPWKETIVGGHCDTFFRLVDLNGDGIKEIVSTEYWGNLLTIISTKNPKGSFANAADISYNVIDANVGHAFDVEVVDVNGDGKPELLVTNHQGSSETPTGSVYAYEIPSDITAPSTSWVKHTLLDKIPVLQGGMNQASPGSPHAFQPKVGGTGKPWIAVSGDGSQKVHLLAPTSENPADWTYTATVLHDCKNTAGGITVADTNKDGWSEVYIPCYDNGILTAYTFTN
ncbi:hypothetical protein BC829DRAFT_447062 [Chytridium lagenaria]|nr:hypothetical protein BC829DRAFT_447062 [Chytridium lagenaria]